MSARRLLVATSMLIIGVAVGVPSTGATYTSTSRYDARVTAAADWTPPHVSIATVPAYVNGVVTVSALASDDRNPVASVVIQWSVADADTWTTLCTDTTQPWSCSWTTTAVADGRYQLRAIATDLVGLSTTSEYAETRVVNSAAVVLTNPGDLLHGSVPLTATFVNGGGSLPTMRIEYVVSGGNNWSVIPGCGNATGSTTRSCTWVTSGANTYDVRAVAVVGTTTYYDYHYASSVDNVVPTVTLTVPSGTLAGIVDLTATADDADSGVDTVTFQYRLVGAGSWSTCGTSNAPPYSCRLGTTTLADGSYEFRAVATDLATNTTTTASQIRTIDNTIASVSIIAPTAGSTVKGTVTVTADANSNHGVASVLIEERSSGGLWTALCTDTVAPYSCSWVTAANGGYELRATLTQGNGATVVSAIVSVTVDNSFLRAQDVQATNSGTSGMPTAGDKIVLTYSAVVDPATIKAGWSGAATTITVDLKDKKLSGALLAGFDRAEFAGTNLGQVAFPQNYVRVNLAASLTGSTMVASTATVAEVQVTVVTITLGTTTQSANLHSTSATGAMTWTPSVLVKTAVGVACSATAAVETGATDKDL
jgi:chitinase